MAANFFDQFDPASAKPEGGGKSGNYFDQFDPGSARPEPAGGTASDLAKSIKVGTQRLPGMVTGLADLPFALAAGARPFTKAADALGEVTGFQPGKWADETKFSAGYDQGKKAVDDAWKDGSAGDIALAYLKNPGYTANQVAESLPSMVAGGLAGRALMGLGRVAPVAAKAGGVGPAAPGLAERALGQWAAPVAGGVGEGAVTAGQQMAQYQGEDQQTNALAALGASVGTGVLGAGMGRVANRLGLETAETAIAKAGTGVAKAADDVPLSAKRRILGGMVSEAVLQELPQSAQEQMWQNWAEGKPLMEGVARAATEGAIAGGVMGAGANVSDGGAGKRRALAEQQAKQLAEAQAEALRADPSRAWTTEAGAADPNQPAGERAAPPEAPELQTIPGAAGPRDGLDFTRDVDTAGLTMQDPAEVERARAATMDYEPTDATPQWDTTRGAAQDRQPGLDMPAPEFDTGALGLESRSRALTPSQQMGIDPTAGPLSKLAASAVDSGLAQEAQFLVATGRDLQVRRTGPGVADESNVIDVQGRVVEDRAIGTQSRLTAQESARESGAIAFREGVPRSEIAAIPNVIHRAQQLRGYDDAAQKASSVPALPAPTNLREGLERIRAQQQEAANAQAATPQAAPAATAVSAARPAAVEAAGPATIPATTGVARESQASQTQQGSTQPTQAGGPQAGAATATASTSPAGGNRVQAAGLTNGTPTQNPGAQAAPAAGAQGQAPQAAVARPDGWRKSMLKAGPVAKAMGIDTKGKRLAQVVAEIDAADAQSGGAVNTMRDLAQQFRDRHAITKQDTDRTFAAVLDQFAGEVEQGKRTPQSVQQAIERYQELAAEPFQATQPAPATHADPGQSPEVATPAVVAQSVQKAARNEDTKPSEMRKWLVGKIDEAIAVAPEAAVDFLSFDVPGDGTFKVQNSQARLQEFRKKVMASPGFKDGGQKQAKPQQNDSILNGGGTTETIRAFLADGDVQGAVEFAKLKGVEFTPVEPRASIIANGKFKRVPASVKSSVPSVAEGLTQVEAEQINQYLTAEQARAEPADAQDADVQQSPQDFIPAPDGGLDYGEITPEMGKAMRRQAGKIRLQHGVQNSNGTGWGLVHIEANHGKQISGLGFGSVQEFVAHVASSIQQVWQVPGNSQLLLTLKDGRKDVMYIQLEIAKEGDFYRVNSAFPVRQEDYESLKGMKKIWDGSEPTSAVTGQRPAFATAASASPESESSQGSSNARGQDASVPPAAPEIKADDVEPKIMQSRPNDWPYANYGWVMVGGGRNAPGASSENGAKIELSKNPEWKERGAVILPFRWNDGGLRGVSPYADTTTRYAILVRQKESPRIEASSEAPTTPAAQPITRADVTAAQQQARADNRKKVKQGAGEAPPVTDFGQKLEGARKDMPPSLKEDVSDEQIANLPLSKVWPSDAHESIEDDVAAALTFAARQEIPSKPRVPSRVRAWVSKVKTYRTLVQDLGENSLERIEQLSKEKGFHSLDTFFAKVRLLSQLPRDTWSRVERVEEYPNAIRYEKDGSKTAVAFSSVTIDGKSRRFEGVGKIGPDEVQKVKEMLGTSAPKKGGLTPADFEVRGTAKTGYKINRKGDSEYRSLKIFTGEDAAKKALAWRDEHTAELEAAWEAVKARDNVSKAEIRRDENRERAGENRRNGKDVTEEMFDRAFGFRGVQFGNWVGQGAEAKGRQGMLNDAYDALLDLADILGIPSKAISLNGTLGLSFGARGSGKAAAHFEPSNLVINLTKTRGAGSLAHEWFHALDNYFSRMRGGEVAFTGDNDAYRQNNFVTYKPEAAWGKAPITPYTNFMRGGQLRERLQRLPGFTYDANKTLAENAKAAGFERDPSHKEGVRPQVEKAFADLVQALNDSPMAKRASSLDKAADGYWGRIIERGARSFENYVISKMAQRGWSNDFLANIRSFDEWMAMGKNAERYPYLKPEEDAPVVAAFDKLFETVETKEDDTGTVVLFSRATDSVPQSVAEWLPDTVIADEVEKRIGGFAQQPPVRIRDTAFGQLPGVARNDNVAGAVHDGAIYLFRDQLGDRAAVQRTLFHELFHYGLRKFLTKEQFTGQMMNLYRRDRAIKEEADRWAATADGLRAKEFGGSEYALARGVDEALAILAEPNGGPHLNQTARAMFVRRVTNWLADMAQFLKMDKAAAYLRSLHNSEARAYIQSVFKRLETDAGGNTLNWSETSEPAFSRTASPSQPAAWDAPTPTGFDDVIYKLQDKNIDLKRVVESITKATGKVSDSINAYLKEELFHKRAAKRVADFGDRELKPLMNKMRLAGLSMEDVEEYLHARHAKEANAVIAQRNPGNAGLQDGGSGMTNAAADNYFAKLDPAQRRKLEAVAKSVDALIEGTRKLYVSYGLEDQAVVDGWANMYQHYIPLMREDKDGGMGTGQGFSVKGKETKGRTGSTRKVVDILANVAMQREKLIVRGEKNIVAQALVGLAQANPNPDFWEVRSQAPTERVFDPKTGVVVDRPDPLFKSRENVAVAKVKDANGKVTEQMVVFNEDNPRAVRMAAAMKNLDAGNLEGLLGVSAKITRYFAAINTQYNPVFGVVNLVRDVQGAMVNLGTTPLAGQQGKIAKDTLSALRGIYGDIRKTRKGGQATSQWSQLWEQMQDDGGTTGYRDLFKTSADRANDLKSILNPEGWMDSKWGKFFTADGRLKVPLSMAQKGATEIFGWLSDYNEAMENGVRLAAYKAALDKGMSREQAASLAKNLTVNFNRKGQAGMQAGAVYAFFNAAMQGTARIGQTLFDMDGGDLSTLRLSKTGKAVVYGGVMLGVMQALALSAAGFDDDDPPEFVRERSLIIPTGDKTYVSIPMPLGLHVIPGIGRHATEFALSGFDKPAKRAVSMVGMFADAFNPIGNAGLSMQTIAPTALDPLVALSENKDWTGKPIARVSSNKAMPGHTQWKDTATGFSKVVAEAINWISGGNEYVAGAFSPTPDQIDYLLAQVGGGVAREAAKVQQTITTAMSGETLPTHKIPLVGRFIGNAASQASQGSAFYANLNKLNELETEIKGLRKDGRFDEASKLTRENPQSILIAMANRAERDVQRLRREKRELIANDASREQVRAKEDQITAVMTRLNEAVERRKAQAAR